MKNRAMKVIGRIVLGLMLSIIVSGKALADEKTGNLVFNAMKKLQDTHQTFLRDVKEIKANRKAAVTERDLVKEQYKKAQDNTLDRREFHARFSYAQAKIYRALYDETKLTHQVAGKQLRILKGLNISVTSGKTKMSAKGAMAVVEAAKPILKNGRSLLASLSKYRGMITDPAINSKLNAAYDTTRMFSNYLKQIETGSSNRYASQLVLKQKLAELIEQLNALYVQTDIFMAMLRDKTTVLKMINQLAASEAAIWAVSDGNRIVAQLSSNVMLPLMDILNESDEDLNLLINGVLDDHQGMETPGVSQRWINTGF